MAGSLRSQYRTWELWLGGVVVTASVLALVLLLGGCSLAPSDEVMKQFSQNERSWCLSVSSVYGTLRMGGSGVQGGTMTCTQEGLAVKDDAARVTMPITVAPQFSVAPTAPVSPR